jgi:hypothetical protein
MCDNFWVGHIYIHTCATKFGFVVLPNRELGVSHLAVPEMPVAQQYGMYYLETDLGQSSILEQL